MGISCLVVEISETAVNTANKGNCSVYPTPFSLTIAIKATARRVLRKQKTFFSFIARVDNARNRADLKDTQQAQRFTRKKVEQERIGGQ